MKIDKYIKYFILFLFCIFIYFFGYLFNYLKYDNKNNVYINGLIMENNILKNEIRDYELIKQNYIMGKVLLRDITSFYDEILIKTDRNVQKGSAVFNEEGLIGIVSDTKKNKAKVKLLSGDYNLSIKINDNYGNLNNGEVTLLNKYSKINVGDYVYTSGLTNVPEGIYVGVVSKVETDINNLGTIVRVKLIDNTNINYVGIYDID